MIPPNRVLYDKQAGRKYYIDSRNDAYTHWRFLSNKRLKCGLGHRMYAIGEYICCERCNTKVKCEVIPFEEKGATQRI